MRRPISASVSIGLLIAMTGSAAAHAFDPNVLQLNETPAGTVRATWTASIENSSLQPTFPDRCSVINPTAEPLAMNGDRSSHLWQVDCGRDGLAGAAITIAGDSDADTIVRLVRRDGSRWTTVARASGDTVVVPRLGAMRPVSVMQRYILIGIEHILMGVDHLLFLVGLWLLVPDRRGLLWTITAFTAGHSVTLALCTLDIVTPRAAPVEVLIAASIVLLAREICLRRPNSQLPLRRQTWVVALGFGLLHGFGFAGALTSLGVPSSQRLLSLGAFNAGVEVGQLAFILALTAAARVAGSFQSLRSVGPQLTAYAIGATATVWVVQRTIQLGA